MVKKVTTTITANLDQSGKLKITVGGEIDSEIAVSILNVVSAIDQIEIKLPISDVDTGGER